MGVVRRLRAKMDRPVTAFVLATLFGFDLACLAGQPAGSRGCIGDFFHPRHRWTCGGDPDNEGRLYRHYYFVAGTNGALTMIDAYHRELLPQGARVADSISLIVDRDDRGVHAPTRLCRWAKMIGPSNPNLASEHAVMRGRVIDANWPELGIMAFGDSRQTLLKGKVADLDGFSSIGFAHNAVAALLFGALGWSIALQTPKMLRATAKAFRTPPRPGTCHSCGYSTAGLTRGVCPECGEAVSMEPRP